MRRIFAHGTGGPEWRWQNSYIPRELVVLPRINGLSNSSLRAVSIEVHITLLLALL
jgi:hypothetical protein